MSAVTCARKRFIEIVRHLGAPGDPVSLPAVLRALPGGPVAQRLALANHVSELRTWLHGTLVSGDTWDSLKAWATIEDDLYQLKSSDDRESFHRKIIDHVSSNPVTRRPTIYVEFGVADGACLRWWRSTGAFDLVMGMDSFRGLPEQWGGLPVGYFASDPRSAAPDDVPLVVGRIGTGMVDQVVRAVLASWPGTRVLHLDCDLRSATLAALRCAHLEGVGLSIGDVLVFDELLYHREAELSGMREWLASDGSNVSLRPIARDSGKRGAFAVTAIGQRLL